MMTQTTVPPVADYARPGWHPLALRVADVFGIDLRALAALRIALALVLLWDLGVRFTDLRAHYTDWGLMPRSFLIDHVLDRWSWSIHLLNGTALFQGTLLAIAMGVAVLLLLGWQSRLMAFVSWLLLISLHMRNPLILFGADMLLKMLLLWAMFLPIGARWSIDAALNTRPPTRSRAVSIASAALLLQVAFIYIFTILHKTGGEWWTGQAVSSAMHLDGFVTPLGHWLARHPWLCELLTWGTLLIEGLGPMLAFLPLGTARIRIAVVLTFWALHLGMGLTLALGLFPVMCMIAWVPYLPPSAWDRVERWLRIERWRGSRWEQWVRSHLRHRPIRIQPTMLNGVVVTILLTYVFFWNLRTLAPNYWDARWPAPVKAFGRILRLDQSWNMFAPSPPREDGWLVIPAQLADGTEIDLITGRAVEWTKPPVVSARSGNSRQRTYTIAIALDKNEKYRRSYAEYLCRWWNESHDPARRVRSLQIVHMRERTARDGTILPPEPVRLWSHACAD